MFSFTTDKEVLRLSSVEVKEHEVEDIKINLMNHLEGTKCLGISAIQVGIMKRLFIFKYKGKYLTVTNPRIIKKRGLVFKLEGCESLEYRYMVARPKEITFEYTSDLGNKVTLTVKGKDARVVMHEMDHLNGVYLGGPGRRGIRHVKNTYYRGR